MICEHGNVITVMVETRATTCWDEGIFFFNRDGQRMSYFDWYMEHNDPQNSSLQEYRREFCHLQVRGCPHCQLVRARVDLFE